MEILSIIGIIAVGSLVWTGLSAWMNEKIIRNEKGKRKQGEAGLMVLSWFLIVGFAFQWVLSLVAVVVFLIPFVVRYAFFDLILNKLMGWKWNFTGTTSKIDKMKIPFWVRFIILLLLSGSLYFVL